jgi:hypothetical protein
MTHKEMVNKVDVYISFEDHQKLLDEDCFLPVFHYPYHHSTIPGELGRIEFAGGFTIYFHGKKYAVNADVILNLLEEVVAIGSSLPENGIMKLKQIVKFLKENRG